MTLNDLRRGQQPTGRISRAIGMTYVRQVSYWTTGILPVEQNGSNCHFALLDND